VGDGTGPAIQNLLTTALDPQAALYPAGPCSTNIDTGLMQAESEPAFRDHSRASYVVLATDGIQSGDCGGSGANPRIQGAVQQLANSGVGTFVIGFGSDVDPILLDSLAVIGGHPKTGGMHQYYDVTDQTSLDTALKNIAQSTMSCDLKLASPPPGGDAGLIYVFFDGAGPAIARNTTHTDGWDYDPGTQIVRFYGATCNQMKSGAVGKTSVVFGCPGAPPGSAPAPR
jgi:hypothetical protein